MLPILVLAGAAGLYWHHHKKSAPAQIVASPRQAQVHGYLMGQEFNPDKLEGAAKEFSRQGLKHEAKDLCNKAAQLKKQAKVAAELCERARRNDQNAMGMILAIAVQAQQGNPRAIMSAKFMDEYIAKNPALELGPNGEVPMVEPPPEEYNPYAPGWVAARAG